MRLVTAFAGVVLAGGVALGQTCPPTCMRGGGPASTDCFIEWGGVQAPVSSCTDGDPSCDVDGAADGTCTFPLVGCINVSTDGCTGPLDGPPTVKSRAAGGATLGTALGALDPASEACTEPGVQVQVIRSAKKLKPGVAKLVVTASSGGKKDVDKLVLRCLPASPSLAGDIQPFFTASCAVSGCHTGPVPGGNLTLDAGQSYGELVNQRGTVGFLVKPRNIAKSKLVKNLLGLPGNSIMPSGCPSFPPSNVTCPDPNGPEIYQVMAWIQAGAQNN